MEILGRIPITIVVDAGKHMVLRHTDFTVVVGIIFLLIFHMNIVVSKSNPLFVVNQNCL